MIGFGFIPDRLAHTEEDAIARPLFGTTGSSSLDQVGDDYASSRDYRHLDDGVTNQLSTNSCWAQFVSNACYLAGQEAHWRGTGPAINRPSVLWAYAVGRYKTTFGKLVDLGTRPRDGLEGLGEHGLVAEKDWAFNAAEINDAPPFDLDLKAIDSKLTGYYFIGDAAASPEQMRAANDKGHFPGLALDVHESFIDHNGDGVYEEPSGDLRGLHMVTVVGYRPGSILIKNSWGTNWGDDGYAWLSDRFVRSHYVKHRCVITAAPSGLAA